LLSDEIVAFEMNREGDWRRVGPSEFIPENDAQYRIHRRDSENQSKLGIPRQSIPDTTVVGRD